MPMVGHVGQTGQVVAADFRAGNASLRHEKTWRLYAMAAKVIKTGRQLFVKLQARNQILLEQVLIALRRFEPPPI